MDGQVLKERLSKLTNLTQMELAEKLSVSQQSFSQYFLAKDVKSGLIEKLEEIIGVDISTIYGQEPVQSINHNAGDVITGDNVANRVNRYNLALDMFRLSFCLAGMNAADLYDCTEMDGKRFSCTVS